MPKPSRNARGIRARLALVLATALLATLTATGMPASATDGAAPASSLTGTTSVTTAPGIAKAFYGSGILPLPAPSTGFRLGYEQGLTATYKFPIVGGKPDRAGPSGDILHKGGIYFVSRTAKLEIGRFDIDLAAGKIFATEVNFVPARIAVLDLDLSGLSMQSYSSTTVLSGIVVRLDPEAAGALKATFGLALPADGSLVFGSATVKLRG